MPLSGSSPGPAYDRRWVESGRAALAGMGLENSTMGVIIALCSDAPLPLPPRSQPVFSLLDALP